MKRLFLLSKHLFSVHALFLIIGALSLNGTVTPLCAQPDASRESRIKPVLSQLLEGQLTPEQAGQSGALSFDDAVYVLERADNSGRIPFVGRISHGDNEKLRRAVAAVLAGLVTKEHGASGGAKRPKRPASVPMRARVWLGDYYASRGDAQAVPVLESILNETKLEDVRLDKTKVSVQAYVYLVFHAVKGLAEYYHNTGNFERAAQTWLFLEMLHAEEGPIAYWITNSWGPCAVLEAARMYAKMGDEKKSQELYEKVHVYNQPWFSALALADQAKALMAKDKLEEARRLLAAGFKKSAVLALPDLVVAEVSSSPANPAPGDKVAFSAIIKNEGAKATPPGVNPRITFFVNGRVAAWSDRSDRSTQPLAPGSSRVVTANGGPGGKSTWTSTPGKHKFGALVDDHNRIPESNEENNLFGGGQDVRKVALRALLSHSYYLTAEFEAARKHGEEAMAQYHQVTRRPPDGYSIHHPEVHRVLAIIDKWRTKPLLVEPQEVRVTVGEDRTKGQAQVTRQLTMRTVPKLPFTVTANHPRVRVQVVEEEHTDKKGKQGGSKAADPDYAERTVQIEVDAAGLEKGFDAVVVASSPHFPKKPVRVPIHVEVPKPAEEKAK